MHFNFMCHEEYPIVFVSQRMRDVYDNDIFSADW